MNFVSPNQLRNDFAEAMSQMYRDEVPQYGQLLELVADVNAQELTTHPEIREQLDNTDNFKRIAKEKHGAIRVGKKEELSTLRRLFAIMGMFPVAYYDLSIAGIPVHSTAFRPIEKKALSANPFRVFTSLLRVELISDLELRQQVEELLSKRNIFSPNLIAHIERIENQRGVLPEHAENFIQEALEVFRWHDEALIDAELYKKLNTSHRLIADVVSFRGPHINHLTPATLNIEVIQGSMLDKGIEPKAVIEGPPKRECPILLRQTSFKALEEPIKFPNEAGCFDSGSHIARFGEIEQRGIALTPKGMELYTELLMAVRASITPNADGSNASEYRAALEEGFAGFPDDYNELRELGLAYFVYSVIEDKSLDQCSEQKLDLPKNINELVTHNLVRFDPVIYEDFLPVSAAGIFQSNLDDNKSNTFDKKSDQSVFESALGEPVTNQFDLYQLQQDASIEACLEFFSL